MVHYRTMKLVADLHIHSHYSRATSKDLTFEHLARWAQLKGIHLLGTGDIAHPGWLQEMHEKLEPAEEGLFRLKPDAATAVEGAVPPACRQPVRFILAGEISNIYKRHGAVRKVHNVIFAPTLHTVARIQAALARIGNIHADGRPILGLDSRDLLALILDIDPRCHLIPAHIWTPWFSMLGSKSGFDSVEQCFGDLTEHIFALETGLSSDPPMNWRIADLDRYTLVSNSDAHSPQKLGREATVFEIEPAYDALFAALQSGDPATFRGTIEFFPEEGKYHLDGHRKCEICWEPPVTQAHGGICPVCGREVTVGVMHRVEMLADRPADYRPAQAHPFRSLIPLSEILAEVHSVGSSSRRVQEEYDRLLSRLGPELAILSDLPTPEIAAVGGERLAEGIQRMRQGNVTVHAGYDGEYGVIKLFAGAPLAAGTGQIDLFQQDATDVESGRANRTVQQPTLPADESGETAAVESAWLSPSLFDAPAVEQEQPSPTAQSPAASVQEWLARLNAEQRSAATCFDAPLVIVAGPGAGKTATLTVRIALLVQMQHVSPTGIMAVTFTNKAAVELAERLAELLGSAAAQVTVSTFHAFGASLLRRWGGQIGLTQNFVIVDDDVRRSLLAGCMPGAGAADVERALAKIATAKHQLRSPDDLAMAADDAGFAAIYRSYEAALAAAQAVDFDDLVTRAVRLLETQPAVLQAVHATFHWISVDEYQDVNFAQHRLLGMLTAGGANLCVIGDPDQAIYGFRGADRRYFLSFQQDYPGARTLLLSRSYRSPQSLLNAAAQVIARSADGASQRLWSDFGEEVKLELYSAASDKAEAEYVVHQIETMLGGSSYFSLDSGRVDGHTPAMRSFGEFAVLFRLSAQAQALREAFDRSGMPYQVVGAAPLYAQTAVRPIVAGLWLLQNAQAHVYLDALLAGLDLKLASAVRDQVVAMLAGAPDLGAALRSALALTDLRPAQRKRMAALAGFWNGLEQVRPTDSVAQLVERLHRFLAEQRGDDPALQPDALRQLLVQAHAHGNQLDAFLNATLLASAADAFDPRADRVTLMTLHAAKGLEFPVVFMVGCEEGLLPYLPAVADKVADIDEERRLFYVGMTRAQRRLVVTHATSRFLFGQRMTNAPSRFVDDIEAALKQSVEAEVRRPLRNRDDDLQLSLF